MSDALAVVREIIEDECVRSDEDVEALRAVLTQAETAEAAQFELRAEWKRAEAAEAERDHAQDALRQIERMAGAAGSGETPAMPIATIARAALGEDT